MEMLKRVKIKIFGQVQGVFFRHYTQREAMKRGVRGFVQNLDDGSVYIEAEAEMKVLVEFIEWCKTGPKSAAVSEIEHEFSDRLMNFREFTIKI